MISTFVMPQCGQVSVDSDIGSGRICPFQPGGAMLIHRGDK